MNAAELRQGRGYGGTAVVWHNNLKAKVTPLTTSSPRICALLFESTDMRLLVMSVYMPIDENVYMHEFNDILDDINSLYAQYDDYDTIIAGDFNSDVIRGNERSRRLLEWCEELGVVCPALLPDASGF